MNNSDILIIGAGAAGLMAARLLAKAGKKVIVLEARDRCGGRIHTLNHQSFFKNAELGAEFVHGDLPVTLDLLKEAGIQYHSANTEMWRYQNGHLNNESFFIHGWDLVIERLDKLEQDISIDKFLKKHFSGHKYLKLRESVCNFVSGYDTGDPLKASSFALRKEWESEDIDATYRIKGGYGALIKYLYDEFKKDGGSINLNSVAKEIHWFQGDIRVITEDGTIYQVRQTIVAVPLGVLQAVSTAKGGLAFYPDIPEHKKALHAMGFGAVIKILLEFDSIFWKDKFTEELAGKSLNNMGYLFSDEEIPTWWTQTPQHSSVLTGWIGGPAAANKKDMPGEEILKQSLQSLGIIFNRRPEELMDKLLAFNIVNWTSEPFTRGSYAYDTVASPAARKLLNTPIRDTLFFAGDYLYEGPIMGTVEAALTSGKRTAERIIEHSDKS